MVRATISLAEGPGAAGAQVAVPAPLIAAAAAAAAGAGERWLVAEGGPDDQDPNGDCPSLTEPLAAPLFGAAGRVGIVDG